MLLNILYYLLLIIGTVINFLLFYLFYFSVVALIAGAVAAICTKPDPTKFKDYVKFHLKHVQNNTLAARTLLGTLKNKAMESLVNESNYNIQDFIICRYATIRIHERDREFIGVFNNWYYIEPGPIH